SPPGSAAIDGDPVQPGRGLDGSHPRPDRLLGADEGVLQHLVGVIRRLQEVGGVPQQVGTVPIHQLGQRGRLPPGNPLDEGGVIGRHPVKTSRAPSGSLIVASLSVTSGPSRGSWARWPPPPAAPTSRMPEGALMKRPLIVAAFVAGSWLAG